MSNKKFELEALGLKAEFTEIRARARSMEQAEQADPVLRHKREMWNAGWAKMYRRHSERNDPGPDSHRGPGNKNAAAYARDNPPPLFRSVKAARLLAMETLRKEAKDAVWTIGPKTPDDVVECVWPAISKYAKEVFDRCAKAKRRGAKNHGGSYVRWLRSQCLPAVIADVCPMDAQFQITARYVADAMVNKDPRTTWYALWSVLEKGFDPGSFMDNLKDRLTADLEVRSLYWEAQSLNRHKKVTAPKAKNDANPQPAAESDKSEGRKKADGVSEERAALLTAYKARGRNLSIRITDEMVAKAANPNHWNDRTMVTWWKRNDHRIKPPHDRMIRGVLKKDPSSLWVPRLRVKSKRV